MTILLENECDIDLGIDYEAIATRVIEAALDYVQCPYECEVNIVLTDNDGMHRHARSTHQQMYYHFL